MTVQDAFNRMMVLDNELDLQSGGADVARGLAALDMCIDWWEGVAASIRGICVTASTLTTTANTETTDWPTTLKRLDDLWLLDVSGQQVEQLDPLDSPGQHAGNASLFPFSSLLAPSPGAPTEYYPGGEGGKFWWAPIPDGVYTLRAYGLWAAANLASAAATFPYSDSVANAVLSFAVKLMRTGLDRDITNIQSSAEKAFQIAAKAMSLHANPGIPSRFYDDIHDT